MAKPGTKLVVLDRSHAIPLFTEVEAKHVEKGEHVCVIGESFLEMARPLLNITARAAEEIREYHVEVLKRFRQISGRSITEKLTFLVQKMGVAEASVENARYWIDIEDQLNIPIHEVVPHAPRHWNTFRAFMLALSFSEPIALRYWTWAVIAQRSHRMSAAINFHDAYRSILVDSYGAQSSNPERAKEVTKLRAAAENFVSIVSDKTEERGDNARA